MKLIVAKYSKALRWGVAVALLVCVMGAFLVLETRAGRELSDLPDAERSALYERTLETLRNSCAHAAGSTLSEYCREQAEFVKRFSECDRDCREVAERFMPRATR